MALLIFFAFVFSLVKAESHTVTFNNKYVAFPYVVLLYIGSNNIFVLKVWIWERELQRLFIGLSVRRSPDKLSIKPKLIVNGETLSSGANYTSDGPLSGAIAYVVSHAFCSPRH